MKLLKIFVGICVKWCIWCLANIMPRCSASRRHCCCFTKLCRNYAGLCIRLLWDCLWFSAQVGYCPGFRIYCILCVHIFCIYFFQLHFSLICEVCSCAVTASFWNFIRLAPAVYNHLAFSAAFQFYLGGIFLFFDIIQFYLWSVFLPSNIIVCVFVHPIGAHQLGCTTSEEPRMFNKWRTTDVRGNRRCCQDTWIWHGTGGVNKFVPCL